MNAEVFAEWMRRQGHNVLRTASSFWYDASPHVYQAIPYNLLIHPDQKELDSFVRRYNVIAMRYSTSLDSEIGKVSYHIVCDDKEYDIQQLPHKVRHDIELGLSYAPVQQIPLEVLAIDGWRLRFETLERQGRLNAESEKWWVHHIMSASDLPGFEAWAAIHDDEIVSSFLAFRFQDCYMLLLQQSSSRHLRWHVNNGIYYVVTQHAMSLPGVTEMFAALESLDAPPSVDNFKLRMRLVAKPLRQRVVWHPWIRPILNRYGHQSMQFFRDRRPTSPMLAKMHGMIRFYLEGNLPINQQTKPAALERKGSQLFVES